MNCNNIPLTTKVGDAVESKNITQLWQDHFSTLLNSVPNIDSKEFVCENIEHGVSDVSMAVVSASDVLDSLKTVKLGKAPGIDGLSAEHFCVRTYKCQCALIITFYFNVISWTHACSFNENCYCAYSKKQAR